MNTHLYYSNSLTTKRFKDTYSMMKLINKLTQNYQTTKSV